jgi:hypothetical protein
MKLMIILNDRDIKAVEGYLKGLDRKKILKKEIRDEVQGMVDDKILRLKERGY